jgi:SAM-dependent methyltransferase
MESASAPAKFEVNGRDFFDQIYQQDLQLEAEWLRLTAVQKTRSISTLLRASKFSPHSLVEIGCGTGAVIRECKRQRLAKRFTAIDYSTTALSFLNAADPNIATRQADITSDDFCLDGPVDAIVCSHVIEHLEEPDAFLTALRDRIDFKLAVIEVPLEDLLGHRWRWRGKDRKQNSAGHVQFFTSKTFEELLARNRFRILATRRYVPTLTLETIRFITARQQLTTGEQLRKVITNNMMPKLSAPLWSRLYYAHYAVLCTKTGG